jgi:hypothetical protein
MSAPAPEELEVTVFGPGFGESVIVHLGHNRWIVFDSCSTLIPKNQRRLPISSALVLIRQPL